MENRGKSPLSDESKQPKQKKAFFISADYHVYGERTYVRLLMKGRRFFRLYKFCEPYFYIDAPESQAQKILSACAFDKGQQIRPLRVEPVAKILFGKEKKLLKVFAKYPFHVPPLKDTLKEYQAYEFNIPFAKRFIIDNGLEPFSLVTYSRRGRILDSIVSSSARPIQLRTMAFDIETYNPAGVPRPTQDPIIMISYATNSGKSGLLTWRDTGKDFASILKGEKEMIEEFCRVVKDEDVELMVGYNTSQFDLPYLQARASALGAKLSLGRDKSSFKLAQRGLRKEAKIQGRIHADLYSVVQFLGIIGALKVSKYTLENAYRELVGKESATKSLVKKLAIWQMWDDEGQRKLLAEYSHNDSLETLELAQKILPVEMQLSRITKTPLFDVVSSTTGQLVESLLMRASFEHNQIVPNKPGEQEIRQRTANMIQGAFVKLPTPGVYENLVVFDFRGLYPSIICSHNIDPYTLNCSDCGKEESHLSPQGHRFCSKKKGLIPLVLEGIMEGRAGLKDKLKKLPKESQEYADVFAQQQALKILANSYYGYLAYARSRWYSRACGESVTAWGRHYITETAAKAQDAGFNVLYIDTDSLFLLLGNKTKEDALAFMKKVNSQLPERMELELEAFYLRGMFVTKKVAGEGDTGAKKKYALLDEQGRIKIRGFELVRRDWSKIAKETQSRVLNAILKEGSKEKAIQIVKDTIQALREGKVPLEDLAVYTQLNKDPDKYLITSPELAAAKKAIKAGKAIDSEAVIAFVITKSGASISEKATVLEMAKDYDANYYIEHQILPSVLKILRELGVTEDDLKFKGKQTGLEGFF